MIKYKSHAPLLCRWLAGVATPVCELEGAEMATRVVRNPLQETLLAGEIWLKWLFHLALFVGAVAAIFWFYNTHLSPAVKFQTTRDRVYLPERYELVESVTNTVVFFKQTPGLLSASAAGGAGIGSLQVTMSKDQYVENERKGVVHYLTLTFYHDRTPTGAVNGQPATLHYYDPQTTKVIYTSVSFEAPAWRHWFELPFGYYRAVSGRIEGKELVLERKYEVGGWTVFFTIVAVGVILALATISAVAIHFVLICPFFHWLNYGTWSV